MIVLTERGLRSALRIRERFPAKTTIFAPSCVVGRCGGPIKDRLEVDTREGDRGENDRRDKTEVDSRFFATDVPGVIGWIGPMRTILPEVWRDYQVIVAVMALGIVVRLIAPLANDKRIDPAVIVVDEDARFAISVLGGHQAGANACTNLIAEILGAVAVVTTASDSLGLPAIDTLGRDLGWSADNPELFKTIAAKLIRGGIVAIRRDAGSNRPIEALPKSLQAKIGDISQFKIDEIDYLINITDKLMYNGFPPERTLTYRPKTLVAGIGCRRGTTEATIERFVDDVFRSKGLAIASLAAFATATIKADEPGLIALAQKYNVPLIDYPLAELADHPGIETPSERVRSKIGVAAVAEPSALLAAEADRPIVPKQIGPGVTVAIARIKDEEAFILKTRNRFNAIKIH